jgi:hypothetical protein
VEEGHEMGMIESGIAQKTALKTGFVCMYLYICMYKKCKDILQQVVKAHRVVRSGGSHIL